MPESIGNVEVERDKSAEESYVPVEDLTYVLPEPMRDPAFIDRVHGVIPGWELPQDQDIEGTPRQGLRHSL
ncbi:MAG: BREX system Lon protease-like protein BrxL [Acidilobus sp.]